jgi:hypothetical protein
MIKKTRLLSQAPVAHACNPSYSEGRDQEDHGLKPAQANSSGDFISQNPITKIWAGRVAQSEGPEFNPQHCKKKTFKVCICFYIFAPSHLQKHNIL